MYERCLPLFAQRYRAVAMDTPGFGMSDPPDSLPADIGYYSRAVIGLLDGLGIERASLIGFHTGASIALDVAVRAPERVDKLVLAGILALPPESDPDAWRSRIVRWEPDGRGDFLSTYPLDYLRDYFVTSGDPKQFLTELIAFLQAGPSYWWATELVVHHNAYALFPQIAVPTLFLGISGDMLVEATIAAQPHVPHSIYVEIEGTDGVVMEEPERFAHAVLDFLGDPEMS